MIYIEFSQEQIDQLKHERFFHPHPRVQMKMDALLLKSAGLGHGRIAELVGVCENTLRGYFAEYIEGGIGRLKEIHWKGPPSDLVAFSEIIRDDFGTNPPATLKEAADRIASLTGIRRGRTQIQRFLKSLGFRWRKVAAIPGKADPDAQEDFKKELEPRLNEARQGKRTVFFVDASHFVLGGFLGYLWTLTRMFVKTGSGRKRFNVLGALHAVTHQMIVETNDTYVNAETVCRLLYQIAGRGYRSPITIILDNAKYQKCPLVLDLAEQLKIELLFLPPYSPNLNLIERFWKFLKKQALASKYHKDFETFSNTILDFTLNASRTHKAELKTLLTHNFQTFENAQVLTG